MPFIRIINNFMFTIEIFFFIFEINALFEKYN